MFLVSVDSDRVTITLRAYLLPVVYSNTKVIQCQAKSGSACFGAGTGTELRKLEVKTRTLYEPNAKDAAPTASLHLHKVLHPPKR